MYCKHIIFFPFSKQDWFREKEKIQGDFLKTNMRTIKIGWLINLLHNLLFIKDNVKKNHFQRFQSLGQ
jgi:hypothetical protein